jgi:PHD/YefM family antitoxin component YafN of YafNO toxin-antitoxin module
VRSAVGKHEPEIDTVDAAEVGEPLREALERVARGKARVVVEQDGKVVAALVSPLDYERLKMLDRRVEDGWRVIEEIRARNAHMDPEEVERDIAEAIEEMRAERRAQAQVPTST